MIKSQAQEYLIRIGCPGDHTPSMEVLRKLQKAHLLTIPFENLDIHIGTEIILDQDKIFKKIVLQQRGGFCYELNGLFYELLKYLGYEVTRISGRVYASGLKLPHEYDHLAIIVTIDHIQYLVDVGYKEFAFAPLKLRIDTPLKDERGTYLFNLIDENTYRVSYTSDSITTPEYVFKNLHRDYEEFKPMCLFQQFHPDSHFRKQKLITLPTEVGRITLTSNKLKITKNGDFTETPIKDKLEFDDKLQKYFGIIL